MFFHAEPHPAPDTNNVPRTAPLPRERGVLMVFFPQDNAIPPLLRERGCPKGGGEVLLARDHRSLETRVGRPIPVALGLRGKPLDKPLNLFIIYFYLLSKGDRH